MKCTISKSEPKKFSILCNFKGPGSIKKFVKIGRNVFNDLLIDTTHTPLLGHFTVPLKG